jgi:hypothetical protein
MTFSFDAGVLKKWQLIFYGTAENPIRLKNNIATNRNLATAASAPARTFTTAGGDQQYVNGFYDFQLPYQSVSYKPIML